MTMTIRIGRRALLATTASMFAATGAVAADNEANGAGGGTIRPMLLGWQASEKYKALGLSVTYQGIGSPAGTSKILAGDTDFAILEIPLSDEQLAAGNLYQFPLAFTAIVFVANIPGVGTNRLQLTGQNLGGIFSGQIKKWNDPKIVAYNPGLSLPDLDIHPIYHAEPGGAMLGDTVGVTSYLLSANTEWQAKFGTTVPKRWSVGSMSTTTDTIVGTVKALEGSIAYLPLGAALSNQLPIVMKRDSAGKAVQANQASLNAAVAAIDWAKTSNLVGKLVDLPGDGVWPVVIASYGVVPRNLAKRANGKALRAFFKFALTDGSAISVSKGGEPAPDQIRARVLAQLEKF